MLDLVSILFGHISTKHIFLSSVALWCRKNLDGCHGSSDHQKVGRLSRNERCVGLAVEISIPVSRSCLYRTLKRRYKM